MHFLPIVPICVVIGACTVASITDIWRFKVYNVLTLPMLAAGVVYAGYIGGLPGLRDSLLAVVMSIGILLVPYVMGAMGAGDVKFVAAIASWLGGAVMWQVIAIGCFATGVYGIAVIWAERRFSGLMVNVYLTCHRLRSIGTLIMTEGEIESVQEMGAGAGRRRRLIPFSAMISFGVLLTLIFGVWNVH